MITRLKGCAGNSEPSKDSPGNTARVKTMHKAALPATGKDWAPKTGSMNTTRLTRMSVSKNAAKRRGLNEKISIKFKFSKKCANKILIYKILI